MINKFARDFVLVRKEHSRASRKGLYKSLAIKNFGPVALKLYNDKSHLLTTRFKSGQGHFTFLSW
jgi:hypothetical protein